MFVLINAAKVVLSFQGQLNATLWNWELITLSITVCDSCKTMNLITIFNTICIIFLLIGATKSLEGVSKNQHHTTSSLKISEFL